RPHGHRVASGHEDRCHEHQRAASCHQGLLHVGAFAELCPSPSAMLRPQEDRMSTSALYLVRMDVAHDHETTFNGVYDREHAPNPPAALADSQAWKTAGEPGQWPGVVRPHTMNRHLTLYQWVGGSAALTGKTPYV